MSDSFLTSPQWFIISAIAGKEKSIAENIKERIATYGYTDLVSNIQVIKRTKTEVEKFKSNDSSLPKNMVNTKLTKWETLSDGNYQKTSIKQINKFPGYIFINMIYNQDVWFVIRNTQGVLGFVGNSGKGGKPIPITESEYQKSLLAKIGEKNTIEEYQNIKKPDDVKGTINVKEQVNYYVGDMVEVVSGKFANHTGRVVEVNNNDVKLAIVEVESEDGSLTKMEVPFSDLSKQ
ncbi:MAG: transcription termination/antitermination protein NusG [Mycoplasmoidaceae bacterium]|nr:MAG: transcription termination/antitermination protein NusG [Mycoplasmoidaceae bacterium]